MHNGKQLLITVKFMLYKETVAIGMGIDFVKGLGRSVP